MERVCTYVNVDISWTATNGKGVYLCQCWYIMNSYQWKGCVPMSMLIYHEQLPMERVCILAKVHISWTATNGKGMYLCQCWYIMNSYQWKGCVPMSMLIYHEQLPMERVCTYVNVDISWTNSKVKGCVSKTMLIYHEQLPRERVWIKDKLDISWTAAKGIGYGSKTHLFIMNSYQWERVWITDKLDILWTATKGKGYGWKTNWWYIMNS